MRLEEEVVPRYGRSCREASDTDHVRQSSHKGWGVVYDKHATGE